jgi:hypothetical protein
MEIDFPKLAQALSESGLMNKAPADMSKEEIETLCKIICFFSVPMGADDVPF